MRGVIWYQGEDNWNRAHSYTDMFSTMIKGWRELWGQGEFPFYYCQIAPYDYSIITEPGKEIINSAYLREAQMNAEKIVPAEIAKQEAILQADAVAEKVTREADARAKATLAQAEAEAKAIRMKLEAEAEGKKMSLLAEAEGFEAMVKAAELNPSIAIQYKMVDQWKQIAGEQVKAFEKIQLGNVTVFDSGQGTTGNFLNNLVKTVAPSLGVLDKLPIGETVKNIIKPEDKEGKNEEKK